jgi:5-aminolevulinate synthase
MDSVLRQSKAVCPFLKRASPAALRALSTATRPQASPCGGTISKLQVLARRCPVMGKALAVQSSRIGPRSSVSVAGLTTFSGHTKTTAKAQAHLHTTRAKDARTVEAPLFPPSREMGELSKPSLFLAL